jgi:hypothetical protein
MGLPGAAVEGGSSANRRRESLLSGEKECWLATAGNAGDRKASHKCFLGNTLRHNIHLLPAWEPLTANQR